MRLVIEDKEDPHGSVNSKGIVEDGYGEGEVEIWDSGTYKLAKNSKSKIEIEVKSEKLSGKFVLLLPNWGRWYKKRLWILIKL